MTININDLATLLAYIGMAFLVGFWLMKSRTFTGLLLTVGGVLVIWLAERSDRKPEHLAGLLVSALVVGGLLFASYALVRARARGGRRMRGYRPSRATQRALNDALAATAAREAAQAEREAAEIPMKPARTRRVAAPAQRAPRQRNGYVVNRGKPTSQSRSRTHA
jgi:hypothetical protein